MRKGSEGNSETKARKETKIKERSICVSNENNNRMKKKKMSEVNLQVSRMESGSEGQTSEERKKRER